MTDNEKTEDLRSCFSKSSPKGSFSNQSIFSFGTASYQVIGKPSSLQKSKLSEEKIALEQKTELERQQNEEIRKHLKANPEKNQNLDNS